MCVCACVCMYVYSVVFDSLWPHGLCPSRLLCPWNFMQRKNRKEPYPTDDTSVLRSDTSWYKKHLVNRLDGYSNMKGKETLNCQISEKCT